MKKLFLLLFFVCAAASAQIGTSRQLLISISPEWNSQQGVMMRAEKTANGWKILGPVWPVMYADSGLAWGLGVHPQREGGRVKHEGDRCSPAGIFELGTFCGYDSAAPTGVRYPYVQSTATSRWVDDPQSAYYNKLIDEKLLPKKLNGKIQWRSAERMKFNGIDYKYVIFVKHNPDCIPGRGSCIFLHLNSPKRTPTSGCTAMDENRMLELLRWIDADKRPLLVQLPRTEYALYMDRWGLPAIPR